MGVSIKMIEKNGYKQAHWADDRGAHMAEPGAFVCATLGPSHSLYGCVGDIGSGWVEIVAPAGCFKLHDGELQGLAVISDAWHARMCCEAVAALKEKHGAEFERAINGLPLRKP